MNFSFERRVALVSGATKGIFFATAKVFAEAGASMRMKCVLPRTNLSRQAAAYRHPLRRSDEADVQSLVDRVISSMQRSIMPGYSLFWPKLPMAPVRISIVQLQLIFAVSGLRKV